MAAAGVANPEVGYRREEAGIGVAALVEWVGRYHRHPLTWKTWKATAGFVDHGHAKREDQGEGEGFPNAVYRCWDTVRD